MLARAAWLLLLVSLPALAQAEGDDYESGTLLGTDSPPGPWFSENAVDGVSLTLTGAAAHRGRLGFQVVDSSAPDTAYSSVAVLYQYLSPTADLHLRTWLRIDATSGDDVYPLNLSGSVSLNTLAELRLKGPNGTPYLFGFDDSGAGTEVPAGADLGIGVWHRVELIVRNVGSASGSRELWIDGTQQASTTGIDWSGAFISGIFIGEPWAMDSWTGSMSFDDTEWSDQPLGTQLALSAVGTPNAGDCVALSVSLRSSGGLAAVAPYSIAIDLSSPSAQPGVFHAQAFCTGAVTQITVPPGSAQTTVYWSSPAVGAVQLEAGATDYAPAALTLQLGAAPSPPVAAGRDELRVGFGCSASGTPAGPLVLLAVLAWAARPGPRTCAASHAARRARSPRPWSGSSPLPAAPPPPRACRSG